MKFIADVHLGKLAKLMRMLGFDVVYNNTFSNQVLVSIALDKNLVLLSRNHSIRTINRLQYFIVASEDAIIQLQEVMAHFNLKDQIRPFTKCLVCNGALHAVVREEIIGELQPNTKQYFNEFWQCDDCKRVYWKGSHYERMQQLIKQIKN